MDTPFAHTTHPPGCWLVALASGLVLWGIAYAQVPAPGTSPADYGATSPPSAERSRLQRWLLNDLDNAVALQQLAAGPAGPTPDRAAEPAVPSPRLVAANTELSPRLAGPK